MTNNVNNKNIIVARNLVRSFINGEVITNVLKNISLEIKEGEFVAIMGRSGAGKSTTLYQLSLLDEPTSGEIILEGKDTHILSQEDKTKFRLNRLGYVFQDYSLMSDLTALENVALPLLMQGKLKEEAFLKAEESLGEVGLDHVMDHLPAALSGGEQQRVSIARAIVHGPKIIFADEPTANLDHTSSLNVMEIFKKLNKEKGITIVMVTHEDEYIKVVDRVIKLDDGRIV
ncbi:MAG: putative transport system ATP-binding protein [Patescibacteria group bacterium]|nr:putative transport system ATP-binding protein [Patescibacteria group bacterium]